MVLYNASGVLAYGNVRPLGLNVCAALWGSFQLIRDLPDDSIIHGIYPVIICSTNRNYGNLYIDYGTGMNLASIYSGSRSPFQSTPFSTATFSSTEFYPSAAGVPVSIGNSLVALTGMQICAAINASNAQGPAPVGIADFAPDPVGDVMITGVGFAIDYTSASALYDGWMPAPFTWPTGHGLAWAVPTSASAPGLFLNGNGLLAPSTGFGFANPATYTGRLGTPLAAAEVPAGTFTYLPGGIWYTSSGPTNPGIWDVIGTPILQELRIPPEANAYRILPGQASLYTQLDGGAPRIRLDKLGTVSSVDVQWTVGPEAATYLYAFRRSVAKYDSAPFFIKLLGIDDATMQLYTAWFVPNTFKTANQTGLTYVIQATLWVVPHEAAASGLSDDQIVGAYV